MANPPMEEQFSHPDANYTNSVSPTSEYVLYSLGGDLLHHTRIIPPIQSTIFRDCLFGYQQN